VNILTQDGSNNTANITQDNSGTLAAPPADPLWNNTYVLNGNRVQEVDQDGASNTANISQTGGDTNVVELVRQDNSAGESGNTANISQIGNFNGTTGFSGFAGGVSGVVQPQVLQTGGGNNAGYVASGDNNSFGFTQDGSGNWINGTSTGDDHQIAIYEHGDGNSADFAQAGNGNNAGLSMDGDDNLLNVRQDQSGASGNNMSVTITGDKNNNYALTGNALAGDALTVRNVIRTALCSTTFGQGDLFQDGSNNALALNVTSSSNAFATYQSGNDNTINGSIGGGNANQAVVAQIGNSNSATFTQTGGGNNVGISQ
jgi:hypothetical protein